MASAPIAFGVTVEPIVTAAQRELFMRVPFHVYGVDPAWVPPLFLMERRRLTPGKNPFFAFGEAVFFVAYREGHAIGRISAQINRLHQQTHEDGAGHFGFFDCIDDQEAAGALVAAASNWLRERGCVKMIGPMNLTINEECGLLVEGFETAPAVFMTQAQPWTGRLLERAGLAKAIDLLAYRMKPDDAGPKARRLAGLALASAEFRIRQADMKHFHRDLGLVVDIFNEAWKDNWGFTPITAAELEMVMGELRYFFRGNCVRFVERGADTVGVMVVLPNYNELIAGYRGNLFPLNWARLAWALWREKVHSARVVLLGLHSSVRGGAVGAGVLAMLLDAFLSESRNYRLDWVEFSWILETNRAMRSIAELGAGPPVKTYRMYEMQLGPQPTEST